MNPTSYKIFKKGDKVTYAGDNREYLRGKVGTVISSSDRVVCVDIDGEMIYAASWAWELVQDEPPVAFMEPHKNSIEAIDAEVTRLKARIAELQTARQVLSSL